MIPARSPSGLSKPGVFLAVLTAVALSACSGSGGGGGGDEEAANRAPTAQAGDDQILSDSAGHGAVTVTLDGSGSRDGDGRIVAYAWDDGHGTTATGRTPSLSLAPGTHVFTLTVEDEDGGRDRDTVTVIVKRQHPIETSVEVAAGTLTIRTESIPAFAGDDLALTGLTADGTDVLGAVAAPAGAQLATTPNPGHLSGNGVPVSGLTTAPEVGARYLVSYEITSVVGTPKLYFASGGGSPFPYSVSVPATPGRHHILVDAEDTDVAALMRLTGELTFASLSCRKAEWTYDYPAGGGQKIVYTVRVTGTAGHELVYAPVDKAIYVSETGSDVLGTGAYRTPYASLQRASAAAVPGDTVYARPGTYAPFEVLGSGSAGKPITYTTLPDEQGQAVIEGDLHQHVLYGGPGVAQDNAVRDGIVIDSRDHVHVRNFTIRNVWRNGILVKGTKGEQHGDVVLADNTILKTGASAISVWARGNDPQLPVTETTNLRLDTILIEYNDVSETNLPTDYRSGKQGVVEAISVGGSVSNVITRYNDVHDTLQYGIDYKSGVSGGAIYGNRIWNIERYGIYIDAGHRFVEDVDIYDNEIWSCRMGVVFSREADLSPDGVQRLERIDFYNNRIWNIQKAGVYCQRHPGDTPAGAITDLRIRFNTISNGNRLGTSRDLNLTGWADADFQTAGVVTDFDFVGNLIYNDTAPVEVIDEFSGEAGFTVADNLVGVDPLFVDPAADPPDLTLKAASPAAGLVAAGYVVAPFDVDANGTPRSTPATAGAYSLSTTSRAVGWSRTPESGSGLVDAACPVRGRVAIRGPATGHGGILARWGTWTSDATAVHFASTSRDWSSAGVRP